MARQRRPWFRLYVEAFSDRKLRQLPPETRFLFIACLGIARQACIPGYLVISERQAYNVADVADFAGMKERTVTKGLAELETVGLLERDDDLGCWTVPRWSERQYESDDVTDRVRRHRAKERSIDVSETLVVTPPDTETENREQIPPLPPLLGPPVPDPDHVLNAATARAIHDALRRNPLSLVGEGMH